MTKAIEPSEVDLGRELINGATDGLLESALEPRAALGRRKWRFREVPGADLSGNSQHKRTLVLTSEECVVTPAARPGAGPLPIWRNPPTDAKSENPLGSIGATPAPFAVLAPWLCKLLLFA